MTYYHLPTSTARNPGRTERKLSDGRQIGPGDGRWTPELAAVCGFVPVVTTPQPADTAQTTHDRSVQLVDGTPTVVWTPRPWTADELAARTADSNRTAIGDRVATHLTALRAIKGSTGTLTGAQLSNAARANAAALLDVIRWLHNRVDTID